MERKTQIHLWYVLLAMLAVIWVREAWITAQQVEPISYSQFVKLLDEGKVADVTIRGELIHGTLKAPLPGDAATRELICGGFTGGGSHNAAWAMSSGVLMRFRHCICT